MELIEISEVESVALLELFGDEMRRGWVPRPCEVLDALTTLRDERARRLASA